MNSQAHGIIEQITYMTEIIEEGTVNEGGLNFVVQERVNDLAAG